MPPRREPPTEIARILRRLRDAAGISAQGEAGRRAGLGQSDVSRFESGRIVPSRAQAAALAEVYGAGEPDRAQLFALAREADTEHRRVATYRPQAARVQREYAELERDSFRVTTFHPTVVPGLLQTDDYARAIAGEVDDPETLERWLGARRDRRALLDEDGRGFVQIVGPGALAWGLGGLDVMAEQLQHLIVVSRNPNVQLGVVAPATMSNLFVLNGFDLYERAEQSPRVIVGTHASVSILDEPEDVAIYLRLLEHVRGIAVWGDEARAVLTDLGRWYR